MERTIRMEGAGAGGELRLYLIAGGTFVRVLERQGRRLVFLTRLVPMPAEIPNSDDWTVEAANVRVTAQGVKARVEVDGRTIGTVSALELEMYLSEMRRYRQRTE